MVVQFYIIMESYNAVARWNRNSCDGDYNTPLLKVGGMQLFKMEGPDSTEKFLPRTIEVAAIIIST